MAWYLVKHRDNFTFTFTLSVHDTELKLNHRIVLIICDEFPFFLYLQSAKFHHYTLLFFGACG
jgi:hypothetical protein